MLVYYEPMGMTLASGMKEWVALVALAGGLSLRATACDINGAAKSPASAAGGGAATPGGGAAATPPSRLAASLPAGTPKTTVLAGSQLATVQRQLSEGGAPQLQAALAVLTKGAD